MKRIQLFALAVALMMAAACNNDISDVGSDISPTEPTSEQMPEVTFTPEEMGYLTELANGTPKISVDSAAKVALQVMGNRLSKSSLSVTAFGTPKAGSLSKSFFDSDIDTTLYVFNAPGDNGFAVISADARIPQQVLAYSETGNLELDSDNPAFDVFLSYATDYAAECIANAQEQRDSIECSVLEKLGVNSDSDTANTISKAKRVIQRFLLTCQCYTTTHVETLSEVKPLIKTNWSQGNPYNLKVGGSSDCPTGYAAGCVAIATSQLIVFWRHPGIINGIAYDWALLEDDKNVTNSKYKQQVSSLVATVGRGVKTDYGCSSSSADMHKALKLFKSMGYSVPNQLVDYKYDKVKNCLDKGWPVMMRGNRTKKKFIVTWYKDGHAWLADGYVNQKITVSNRLTYVVVEVDDETGKGSCRYEYSGSGSSTSPCYLHLNWGWGASSNGYYCKDVFDAKERYKLGADGQYVRDAIDKDKNYKYNLEFVENLHK